MQSKGCSVVSQDRDDQQCLPFNLKLVNAMILGILDRCISNKSFNGFNNYLLFLTLTLTLDNCTSGLTLKSPNGDVAHKISNHLQFDKA